MAKKASAAAVAADLKPVDFRWGVQHIRGDYVKKKDKIASVNGEIADFWAKMESRKINKKAGKMFAALDKLEHEERVDIMRSLNGLIDAAGWDEEEADLVDQAQDNVVSLRVGKREVVDDSDDTDDIDEALDDDDVDEIDQVAKTIATKAPPDASVVAVKKAKKDPTWGPGGIEAARAHLAGQPHPADDSDLAGDTVPGETVQ
jgi:hypothetical protein